MTDRVGASAPAGRAPCVVSAVFAGFAPRASPLIHLSASRRSRIGSFECRAIGETVWFLFGRTENLM